MKLYRSILLNDGEKIDSENIGCSWTLDYMFAEDHAEDINRFYRKDGYVIISTDVTEDMIDWSNTLFAMEHRPHECEVVIGGNIKCEVHSVDGVEFDEEVVIEGNVGDNDFEDYCHNYDGEITKADFLKFASEF